MTRGTMALIGAALAAAVTGAQGGIAVVVERTGVEVLEHTLAPGEHSAGIMEVHVRLDHEHDSIQIAALEDGIRLITLREGTMAGEAEAREIHPDLAGHSAGTRHYARDGETESMQCNDPACVRDIAARAERVARAATLESVVITPGTLYARACPTGETGGITYYGGGVDVAPDCRWHPSASAAEPGRHRATLGGEHHIVDVARFVGAH